MKPCATTLALALLCLATPVFAQTSELRVSLFPYIPDRAAFAVWIEREFEARHPGVDLIVDDMNAAYEAGYGYDPENAARKLLAGGDDRLDMLEIDTVTLDALVDLNALTPFEVRRGDYYGFARTAVRTRGRTYGVPHWTCGYFVITEHQRVSRAANAREFVRRLQALRNGRAPLVGDLSGSWTSPSIYLDAYIDTYPGRTAARGLSDANNGRVLAALRDVGTICRNGACGVDGEAAQAAFARGEYNALVGYSENLNGVLRHPDRRIEPARIRIAPAPLGAGNKPYMFTDALVLSRRCDGACRRAAQAFAEFYLSDEVMAAMMMSRDAPGAPPRYLLPATRGAMRHDLVRRDPIYRQLARALPNAVPYPNAGLPAAVEAREIRGRVDRALQNVN